MFNFIKSWFRKPAPMWIGTVEGQWISPAGVVSSTFFALYEDEAGNRTYQISGVNTNIAEMHKVYGKVVVPWLGGCRHSQIVEWLTSHNHDYWNELGYDTSGELEFAIDLSKSDANVRSNEANNVIDFPGSGGAA